MGDALARRTRRFVLVVAGVLLTLSAAGALFQAISVRRESARFPPPGQLVDVGGRRLHMLCIGHGQPTVIFESSGFGNALSFTKVRTELSARTRVCSYDRMGTGWSDPGPAIIPVSMFVDDLARLLDRARLQPPYILVPSSIGGLTAELFARRHPDQVAGLVFLDAASSGALEHFAPRLTSTITAGACLAPMAARLGIIRLIDPFDLRRERSDEAARSISRVYRPEPLATLCGVVRGIPRSLEEFRAAPTFRPDVPLTVLTAETTEGLLAFSMGLDMVAVARERRELHQALARRSSRGTWRIVPGSNHLIGSSQPQAVVAAVLDMLAQIRGTPR